MAKKKVPTWDDRAAALQERMTHAPRGNPRLDEEMVDLLRRPGHRFFRRIFTRDLTSTLLAMPPDWRVAALSQSLRAEDVGWAAEVVPLSVRDPRAELYGEAVEDLWHHAFGGATPEIALARSIIGAWRAIRRAGLEEKYR